jgi:hypothetical protein
MTDESLENLMLRTIERWWAGRFSERHGLVTSYDPNKYLAKVKFQPEGQESGWLPIETGHIGQGYGIAIGLQPGSGQGSDQQGQGSQQSSSGSDNSQNSQAMGDQVIVRFQENDFEGGKIVQRVHSDQDKPPGPVYPGEMVFWTKFKKDKDPGPDAADTGGGGNGQQIWFRKDGSIEITDGNGASLKFDGKGNINFLGVDYTQQMNGNKNVTINGQRNDTVKKTWSAKAMDSLWAWLTVKSDIDESNE